MSRSLHSCRSAAPDTRCDRLVHLRSVPLPVALGGDDHSSAPPAALSTGTDRLFRPLGVTGAESSAWGNWRRALRLDYMARSRRQGRASLRDPDASTIDRARSAMRRRLRVTLALYTPWAKQAAHSCDSWAK